MNINLLSALVKQYEGEIAVAEANVAVYTNASVGIGEHPDIVEAVHTQIAKIAEAEEHLGVAKRLLNEELEKLELEVVRDW